MCARACVYNTHHLYILQRDPILKLVIRKASTNSNSLTWNSGFTRIHINIVTGKHKKIKCRSCFVSCKCSRRLCDRQQIAVVVISNVILRSTHHITMQYSNRLRKQTSHWNITAYSGPFIMYSIIYLFSVALRPNAGHGLLIHEVSTSHKTTHHSR